MIRLSRNFPSPRPNRSFSGRISARAVKNPNLDIKFSRDYRRKPVCSFRYSFTTKRRTPNLLVSSRIGTLYQRDILTVSYDQPSISTLTTSSFVDALPGTHFSQTRRSASSVFQVLVPFLLAFLPIPQKNNVTELGLHR